MYNENMRTCCEKDIPEEYRYCPYCGQFIDEIALPIQVFNGNVLIEPIKNSTKNKSVFVEEEATAPIGIIKVCVDDSTDFSEGDVVWYLKPVEQDRFYEEQGLYCVKQSAIVAKLSDIEGGEAKGKD